MTDVSALLVELFNAKISEKKWSTYRIHCELQLLKELEANVEAGTSQTWKMDDYKVTITQPVTRALTKGAIEAFNALGDKSPVIMKPTLCKKTYDSLPAEQQILTDKLGKIGVKIEKIEEK